MKICEIVRSLSFANASGSEKCAPCVAWQQETVMWYNHHMHVYVYSVNRKPPISTYERIFIDVLCA